MVPIWYATVVLLVLGICDIVYFCIKEKKEEKQKELLRKEENYKKREYCNYFMNQLITTNSLNSILNVHKLVWALGLRNKNIGPDESGMFRTEDILKMTSKEVYLGNVSGLPIKTLSDWSNNPKDEYKIVLSQYKNYLISNLLEIRSSL